MKKKQNKQKQDYFHYILIVLYLSRSYHINIRKLKLIKKKKNNEDN